MFICCRSHVVACSGLQLNTARPPYRRRCPHLHRDQARRCPHLHRDWAHRCHICIGTGLAAAHICAGTGAYSESRAQIAAIAPARCTWFTSREHGGSGAPAASASNGKYAKYLCRVSVSTCAKGPARPKAEPGHICAGTTAHRCPHLRRDCARRLRRQRRTCAATAQCVPQCGGSEATGLGVKGFRYGGRAVCR